MTWLLDTNVCIRYLNGTSPQLRAKLDSTAPSALCVCSIVKAELFFGAARSRDPQQTLFRQRTFLSRFLSFPFDDLATEAYATIRADLTAKGLLIGPNDLLIAAICLSKDLTLVTHNVSEFSRVARLKIEDWEA